MEKRQYYERVGKRVIEQIALRIMPKVRQAFLNNEIDTSEFGTDNFNDLTRTQRMDCLMAYLDLARYDADWLIDDLNMADKQFFIDLLDTFTSFVSLGPRVLLALTLLALLISLCSSPSLASRPRSHRTSWASSSRASPASSSSLSSPPLGGPKRSPQATQTRTGATGADTQRQSASASLSLSHTHTRSLSLSLSLSLSHTHTHTHTITQSHNHAH